MQVSDSPSDEVEVNTVATTTTPLTSPVKLSRGNVVTHASSAPSSVGVNGPETPRAPLLTPSDSDDAEKNKKKVLLVFC